MVLAQKQICRDFPVGPGVKIPLQGAWVLPMGRELRSHMLLSQETRKATLKTDAQISVTGQRVQKQTLCQLIYHKEGNNIQWRKESLFSKWCRDNWIAPCKRMKL